MPLGFGFLSAFLAKIRTKTYFKKGTSGAAAAWLTEKSIPEMEETIDAKAGDMLTIFFDGLIEDGPGNDILRGELPSIFSGPWEIDPENLENITDGNDETSTTTGKVVYGTAAGLIWDLGSIKTVTARVKVGGWIDVYYTTHFIDCDLYASPTGETSSWTKLDEASTNSATEKTLYLNGVGEYRFWLLHFSKRPSGAAFAKIYTLELCNGNANYPPYLSFWPEINGIELLPKGERYLVPYETTPLSLANAYEVLESGSYQIGMKWQELPRAAGEKPYECYHQIKENNRSLIIQHIRS